MNEICQTITEITETPVTPVHDKALETQKPIQSNGTPATIPSPNNGNTTSLATKPLNGLTKEAQLSLDDQVNNLLNLKTNHTQILDNCSNIVVVNTTNNTTSNTTSKTNDNLSKNNVAVDNDDDEEYERSDKILDNSSIMANTLRKDNDGDRTMTRRKRLISTSLTKTPIIDGEFEDYHQHKLKNGEDKFDPKYKLYAVVVSNDYNCHLIPLLFIKF